MPIIRSRLAGGGGAQVIYSAAVGRRSAPHARAVSPHYLLPPGHEPYDAPLPSRAVSGHRPDLDGLVRQSFLSSAAGLAGRDFVPAPDTSFAALWDAQLDVLGDVVADHLDAAAVIGLIEHASPSRPAGSAALILVKP